MGQDVFTVQLIEGTSSRPLVSEPDVFMSGLSVVVVKPLVYFLVHKGNQSHPNQCGLDDTFLASFLLKNVFGGHSWHSSPMTLSVMVA